MNFCGLDIKYRIYKQSTFVIVPIPYDLTSTYKNGARFGPASIIEASKNMELYDEELHQETYLNGIYTTPFIEQIASGPEKMNKKIKYQIMQILSDNKIPIILGGDHSVTLGVIEAMSMEYNDLSVVQFDAHTDLREKYQESLFSHACIGRRISEILPLTQVGIRSMSIEEAIFLKKNSNTIVSISANQLRKSKKISEKKIISNLHKNVYITIDIDVLDPSIMPSTGTPEPNGLSWKEILDIILKISKNCIIRGFDVVEFSPIPGIIAPDFLVAKLIYRIMGYLNLDKNENKIKDE